jgi:hypothetical protein
MRALWPGAIPGGLVGDGVNMPDEQTRTDTELIGRFLDVQYGTQTGTAWIGINGSRPFDHGFEWPRERELLIREIARADAESDVWFAVHLSEDADSRSRGNARERRRLHADLDHVITPEDARKIAQLRAWAVQSGTLGHLHVYVELDRSLDQANYELLEESLAAYFGGDRKTRDNDLLRIPGTHNHKTDPPNPVRWDGRVSDKKWNPEELLRILPRVQAKTSADDCDDAITPEPAILPRSVLDVLAEPSGGDRSAKTPRIVNACKAAGLNKQQTLFAVLGDPEQAQRYNEKGIRFMYREIHRLFDTCEVWTQAMDAELDWLMSGESAQNVGQDPTSTPPSVQEQLEAAGAQGVRDQDGPGQVPLGRTYPAQRRHPDAGRGGHR